MFKTKFAIKKKQNFLLLVIRVVGMAMGKVTLWNSPHSRRAGEDKG